MTKTERLERMKELLGELGEHVEALEGAGEVFAAVPGKRREALETMPESHGAVLDVTQASDAAIAQFMLLETPVAIPSDFPGARALLEQLASEAELVGRRANYGHCWRVGLGAYNGEFRIWTARQGRVEVVEYVADER